MRHITIMAILGNLMLSGQWATAQVDPAPSALPPADVVGELRRWVDDFGGYLWTRHYWHLHQGMDTDDVYEWRLRLPVRVSEHVSGVISADAGADYGFEDESGPGVELHEAYADITPDVCRIRVGRQVIRWGKGDEINPTDGFTPEDLSEALNLDRADRKLPVLALYPRFYVGDRLTWDLVWLPRFRPNVVGDVEDQWDLFVPRNYRSMGFAFEPEDPPDDMYQDSVWATKIVYQGDLGDASVSYAYHFEQNASYEVSRNPDFVPGGDAPPATVETVWRRVHSIGGDFEAAHEGWGFRGEAVYTIGKPHITFDPADTDTLAEKDTITCLLGVDRLFRNDFYLNLQLIQDVILGYEDDMEPHPYEASATFRFWKQFFRQTLRLQFTGRYFFTDPDYFYKVNAIYELKEALELDVGLMVFGGEEEGLFGQFDDNDQLFASVKYSY
jgi:hypothetical protein